MLTRRLWVPFFFFTPPLVVWLWGRMVGVEELSGRVALTLVGCGIAWLVYRAFIEGNIGDLSKTAALVIGMLLLFMGSVVVIYWLGAGRL